ncbi:MAG: hypothetical protein ACR2OH_08530 [Microthrixaceae bacterium]
MKNRKVIIAATFAALAVGGLSAGSFASAQSYGDGEDSTSQTQEVPAASTFEAQGPGQNDLVPVQDVEGENPEGEAQDGERRRHRGGCNLEDAAAAIGIEETELRESLDSGQSIADVAEANGVSTQDVIDAMVAAKSERIAEKVEEGRLTQAEADEKLAEVDERITDRVNGAEDTPQS